MRRCRPVDQFTQVLRGRRLVQLDVRAPLASVPTLHTTYPRLLILPQDQTEQILTDHLSELGVAIERGVTFEGLVQREDAIQAELCHRSDSPAGAQGMNTGIQDAYNLAWKLAAVEHGHADPTLLDSYHRERHPVGQALLRTTDRAFSLGASSGVLPRFFRGHLMPHLVPRVLTIPAVRRLAVGLISQLRIAYPDSPLNAEYGHGWRHGPRPGDRAREGDVIGAGVTRIFEVLRGTHHTVLLFAAGSDPRGLLQHATHLEQRHPGLVLARVVCTEPPATSQPRLLHDPQSTLHRAYGADQPTSFVIRPDGHIASRIRPATTPQLTTDLDTRLRPRRTPHEQSSSSL